MERVNDSATAPDDDDVPARFWKTRWFYEHPKSRSIQELMLRWIALEQQANGATDEITRRDAELKTLKTKADQLMAERRRVEQQLTAAKEEAA